MHLDGREEVWLILLQPHPYEFDGIFAGRFRQQGDFASRKTRRALLEHGDDVGPFVAQLGGQFSLSLRRFVDECLDALHEGRDRCRARHRSLGPPELARTARGGCVDGISPLSFFQDQEAQSEMICAGATHDSGDMCAKRR